MTWDNCKKHIFIPRSTYTSALFKVLLTLKILHGSRSGARGSTLEDIAMHMIKYFCLDGDIKSQVLSTLKYGVKMNMIQKRKEKFSLILPASAIQLAPCKLKNEEIERLACLYPPKWHSNACGDSCAPDASCCGKPKDAPPNVCCQQSDDESDTCDPCKLCKLCKAKEKSSNKQSPCMQCFPKSKKRRPCPKPQPPVCARKRKKESSCSRSLNDDPCQMCPAEEEEEETCDPCDPCSNCRARRSRRKHICPTKRSAPKNPCCYPSKPKRKRSRRKCASSKRSRMTCSSPKRKRKPSCPKPQPPKCARKRRKKSSCSSVWDDYCELCPFDDDDSWNKSGQEAYKNCECCGQ